MPSSRMVGVAMGRGRGPGLARSLDLVFRAPSPRLLMADPASPDARMVRNAKLQFKEKRVRDQDAGVDTESFPILRLDQLKLASDELLRKSFGELPLLVERLREEDGYGRAKQQQSTASVPTNPLVQYAQKQQDAMEQELKRRAAARRVEMMIQGMDVAPTYFEPVRPRGDAPRTSTPNKKTPAHNVENCVSSNNRPGTKEVAWATVKAKPAATVPSATTHRPSSVSSTPVTVAGPSSVVHERPSSTASDHPPSSVRNTAVSAALRGGGGGSRYSQSVLEAERKARMQEQNSWGSGFFVSTGNKKKKRTNVFARRQKAEALAHKKKHDAMVNTRKSQRTSKNLEAAREQLRLKELRQKERAKRRAILEQMKATQLAAAKAGQQQAKEEAAMKAFAAEEERAAVQKGEAQKAELLRDFEDNEALDNVDGDDGIDSDDDDYTNFQLPVTKEEDEDEPVNRIDAELNRLDELDTRHAQESAELLHAEESTKPLKTPRGWRERLDGGGDGDDPGDEALAVESADEGVDYVGVEEPLNETVARAKPLWLQSEVEPPSQRQQSLSATSRAPMSHPEPPSLVSAPAPNMSLDSAGRHKNNAITAEPSHAPGTTKEDRVPGARQHSSRPSMAAAPRNDVATLPARHTRAPQSTMDAVTAAVPQDDPLRPVVHVDAPPTLGRVVPIHGQGKMNSSVVPAEIEGQSAGSPVLTAPVITEPATRVERSPIAVEPIVFPASGILPSANELQGMFDDVDDSDDEQELVAPTPRTDAGEDDEELLAPTPRKDSPTGSPSGGPTTKSNYRPRIQRGHSESGLAAQTAAHAPIANTACALSDDECEDNDAGDSVGDTGRLPTTSDSGTDTLMVDQQERLQIAKTTIEDAHHDQDIAKLDTSVAASVKKKRPTAVADSAVKADPTAINRYEHIYKQFSDIFSAVHEAQKTKNMGVDELACIGHHIKQLELWNETMSNYLNLFTSCRSDGTEGSARGGGDANSTLNEAHIDGKYFEVHQCRGRHEVVDIVTRACKERIGGWLEHPANIGLMTRTWNLLWTWSRPKIKYESLFHFQKVNHFPGSRELTRKDTLKINLERFTKFGGKVADAFGFMPRTFCLPKEYLAFMECFSRVAEEEEEKFPLRAPGSMNWWILKPAGSSRGRGISLLNDIGKVTYGDTAIIQRYIYNPFLLDGYKFDLRLYVLVTSFNPLEAFIYDDGFVRIATVPYSTDPADLHNKFIHLTNSSIQKDNETSIPAFKGASRYHSNAAKAQMTGMGPTSSAGDPHPMDSARPEEWGGSKLRLSYLWRRFREQGIDCAAVKESIHEVVLRTLIAAEESIPPQVNSFEVFGFDVFLDSDLTPWLIEVNASPAMACDHKVDQLVKHQMVEDTVRLVNPLPFDRRELLHALKARKSELDIAKKRPYANPSAMFKSHYEALASRKGELNAVLGKILKGNVPRPYGTMPDYVGNYIRLAPGTSMYKSAVKMRAKTLASRKAATGGVKRRKNVLIGRR